MRPLIVTDVPEDVGKLARKDELSTGASNEKIPPLVPTLALTVRMTAALELYVEELAAHCTTVGVVQLVVPQRSSATIDVGVGLIVPKLMPYMVMVLLDDAGPFSVGTWLSTGAS